MKVCNTLGGEGLTGDGIARALGSYDFRMYLLGTDSPPTGGVSRFYSYRQTPRALCVRHRYVEYRYTLSHKSDYSVITLRHYMGRNIMLL